jgi:hypothetical protein
MSAPHTDPEQQYKRHKAPIIGMAMVVVFAVGLILYWLFEEAGLSNPPSTQQPSQMSGPSNEGTATTKPDTQP